MSKTKGFWIFKTEPNVFSFEDLKKAPNQTSCWEGVRNYQARNYLRDVVKTGDDVLIYHSQVEPRGVFGVATVVKQGYVDHFAFDKKSPYYDPKSKPEKPTWYMVDIKYKMDLKRPVTIEEMRKREELKNMKLLQRANRLSIIPITKEEFDIIIEMSQTP